jgi:large subunit ribosomal protein L4
MKNLEKNMVILDKLVVEAGKTKDLRTQISKVLNDSKASIILSGTESDKLVKRAGNNIPNLTCLSFNMLNAHALYYSEKLVLTEESAKLLGDFLNK